jgi:O-antigen/teichoic acid export membrane protein
VIQTLFARLRRARPTLAVCALLFFLPLVLFWAQTVGGKTLVPGENLYQFPPYAAHREALGIPLPHNALVSDLVLQNLQWKLFTREAFAGGELPLWNPYQFGGIPFLAGGQPSALYPLNAIFLIGDVYAAYGWFTVVHLWLAGLFMFGCARRLGAARPGAALAGVVFQLCGFFTFSAVFPMIIAAGVWLPLVVWMLENLLTGAPLRGKPAAAVWLSIGAGALGCAFLAGHVEIVYYTLLIGGAFTAVRLLTLPRSVSVRARAVRAGLALGMVVLGAGLGAAQFVPLFEHASTNFRVGSASMEDVRAWAHPARDVALFAMPNVYGNAAQHGYIDLFTGRWVDLNATPLTALNGQPLRTLDWGIKNSVEAALYVGIAPLVLAAFGLFAAGHSRAVHTMQAVWGVFGLLALTFMFGLPTYRLLLFLPGIDQLHSPFRWAFALTFSVALLAAYGLDAALRPENRRRARAAAVFALGAGAVLAAAVVVARVAFPALEPAFARVLAGLALADRAFTDARMFFSVSAVNVLILAAALAATGAAVLARRPAVLVLVAAADLLAAAWGFNPASSPAWAEFTPPSIAWLSAQAEASRASGEGGWRYLSLNDPTLAAPDVFQANMTLRDRLEDLRGYESIIPGATMRAFEAVWPQVQKDFNRVAPLYTVYPDGVAFSAETALTSRAFDLLNIRYIVAAPTADLTAIGYTLAYEGDGVRIWENPDAYPRAYPAGAADASAGDGPPAPVVVTRLSAREVVLGRAPDGAAPGVFAAAGALVYSEQYAPGWRAFATPLESAGATTAETPVSVSAGPHNLILITPDPAVCAGGCTLRLIYSPQSVNIGLFASFTSAAVLVLVAGAWLWRGWLFPPLAADAGAASRVARNSAAPIVLNLFNRGIDFAFAFVMLRVLGPESAGAYFYAGVIFVWFDILTNFGLNLYLTREAARDRARAPLLWLNTSALRVILAVLGVPLLAVFLLVRQSSPPPLAPETVLAIALLYIGLLPNSLSSGLTALFYAYERAELPAATATIATLCKAVLGLIALLAGAGIIGLAGVSIITNMVTFAILVWAGRAMLAGVRRARVEGGLIRSMVGESRFLMLNHLLATVFFQIDVILIEAIHGTRMVGQYSVAYKWLSALNVIPSFFTQALLPGMARQAGHDRAGLSRSVAFALRLLVSTAFPIAVVFTFTAETLVGLLGGAEYLPDSAIATQIMIWSIPIGWMNSLLQYVLIAVDLHRRITRAFSIAVAFNLGLNLVFIPQYGYVASAVLTIASEAVLFVLFTRLLVTEGGMMTDGWAALFLRPALAAALMAAVTLALAAVGVPVAAGLAVGGAAYAAALWGTGVFTRADLVRLRAARG